LPILLSFPTRRSSDLSIVNFPNCIVDTSVGDEISSWFKTSQLDIFILPENDRPDVSMGPKAMFYPMFFFPVIINGNNELTLGQRSEEHTSELQSRENI